MGTWGTRNEPGVGSSKTILICGSPVAGMTILTPLLQVGYLKPLGKHRLLAPNPVAHLSTCLAVYVPLMRQMQPSYAKVFQKFRGGAGANFGESRAGPSH
jgi:hypothetical protein